MQRVLIEQVEASSEERRRFARGLYVVHQRAVGAPDVPVVEQRPGLYEAAQDRTGHEWTSTREPSNQVERVTRHLPGHRLDEALDVGLRKRREPHALRGDRAQRIAGRHLLGAVGDYHKRMDIAVGELT